MRETVPAMVRAIGTISSTSVTPVDCVSYAAIKSQSVTTAAMKPDAVRIRILLVVVIFSD